MNTLADRMNGEPLPQSATELRDYLALLQSTLIAARAGRAHLVTTLSRVRAAANFLADRQKPDISVFDSPQFPQSFNAE